MNPQIRAIERLRWTAVTCGACGEGYLQCRGCGVGVKAGLRSTTDTSAQCRGHRDISCNADCVVHLALAVAVPPETPRPDLRALIAKWRSFTAEADRRDIETGRGSYVICAAELEAALSVESVPQRLAFRFRCRECETETDHRYVLSGPDRIIVQCLACAETCCVFERSVESVPPAPKPPTKLREAVLARRGIDEALAQIEDIEDADDAILIAAHELIDEQAAPPAPKGEK